MDSFFADKAMVQILRTYHILGEDTSQMSCDPKKFYGSKVLVKLLARYRKFSEESEGMESEAREKYLFKVPETDDLRIKKCVKAGRKATRYRDVLEDLLIHSSEWAG